MKTVLIFLLPSDSGNIQNSIFVKPGAKSIRFAVLFLFLLAGLTHIHEVKAQTIWTGPTMTFTKPDSADWTLKENQDRITDSVWITRQHRRSLINIVKESSYSNNLSPKGTRWAFGKTSNLENLTFSDLETTNGSNPASMLDKNMVLHLVHDDIYIDIKFTSFSGGASGGGFSYERSTNQMSGIQMNQPAVIKAYPNPFTDEIRFTGLSIPSIYRLENLLGEVVQKGTIYNNQPIKMANHLPGVYILTLNDSQRLKVIKN